MTEPVPRPEGEDFTGQDAKIAMDKASNIEVLAARIVETAGQLGMDVAPFAYESIHDFASKDPREQARRFEAKNIIIAIATAAEASLNTRNEARPNQLTQKVDRQVYEFFSLPYLMIGQAEEIMPDEKDILRATLRDVTGVVQLPPYEVMEIMSKTRRDMHELAAEEGEL